MENSQKYIGYDYKRIVVRRKFEAAWVDGYSNFGWELEKSRPAIEQPVRGSLQVMLAPLALLPGSFFKDLVVEHESCDKVELHFKRDRKIQNKNKLNRLQFNMESTLNNMEEMEKTKTFGASVAAFVTGLVGTVSMAVSTFSYLASNIPGCIGFAVPGFIGWILSAVVYSVVKAKKKKKVVTELESKFDEMNDICLQAQELTANC